MSVKRVRMLLRVSSNQQLEADGDLSIQRQIVMEYIGSQDGWILDRKEYFEGSRSGYKNPLSQRETLQEALEDARGREYDILAVYKDDRVGRRMWEMGAFIMALKSCGVDTYTVKDGLISPEMDDVMGQMMLALRYGNAQKSSSDTGMRVKDTAQKLVQQGKFMGGAAPYGYELVLSGEISKHGRALHELKIIPEQAEAVRHIYDLSLYWEYGSARIAKALNEDAHYKGLAPRDVWKEGTITSILTNPVYAGYTAYRRREHSNGRFRRLDQEEWIRAKTANADIKIIEDEMWNLVQEKRKKRYERYRGRSGGRDPQCQNLSVIGRNAASLPLLDLVYCGYCGAKLVNGSRYHYWTIKATGERKSGRTAMYRCRNEGSERCRCPVRRFHADRIEKAVFQCLEKYIAGFLTEEDLAGKMREIHAKLRRNAETDLQKEHRELKKLQKGIEAMEGQIPAAMEGTCPLTMEELAAALRVHRKKEEEQKAILRRKEEQFQKMDAADVSREEVKKGIPALGQVFQGMGQDTKGILAQKLIEKILVTQEQITIRFRFGRSAFPQNGSETEGRDV